MDYFSLIPYLRKNTHLGKHRLLDIVFIAFAIIVYGTDDLKIIVAFRKSLAS